MENSSNEVAKLPNYELTSSADTLHLAKDLTKFIKENKLTTPVQGNQHVNVEGWQYAGMRLGLTAIVQDVQCLSTGEEVKYAARVDIIQVATGNKVGSGYAICSNKEQGKKYFQEYAIASMAQTRAIGKGFRNLLAWIIKAAGYEPTPSEEMDAIVSSDGTPPKANAADAPKEKPVKPITKAQQQEIAELITNEYILEEEKAKATPQAIAKLSAKRAAEVIASMKAKISERKAEME